MILIRSLLLFSAIELIFANLTQSDYQVLNKRDDDEEEDYVGYIGFYTSDISASILMTQYNNGSVNFDFIINKFVNSTQKTEYPWHIHENPIDKTGNCNSAGPHWDPTKINPGDKDDKYKCNPKTPLKCQAGDISGKHGKLIGKDNNNFTVIDDQIKIKGKDSIINKSVVIHYPTDKRRLVCGTIKRVYVKDLEEDNESISKSSSRSKSNGSSPSTYSAITATITSNSRQMVPYISTLLLYLALLDN